MTFADNKELNEILREQFPDGLILTRCAVGKLNFEVSFINEERRVAALNRPFHLQDKAIASSTLGSGAHIVCVGIMGIPRLDSNRLTEILSLAGMFWD
ncbi:hypothetical protein [Parasitella parasitica]|uniref:Uncharacterized protein n=1 Tax=Parasitella parasitica TaxID=35722 RepID=A0A0B7N9L1_9FUNG|nr:hypothetical protein [Parasitella parasitica]